MIKYFIPLSVLLVLMICSCDISASNGRNILSDTTRNHLESYHIPDSSKIVEDTLIGNGSIRVVISNKRLDTHVRQEYKTDDKTKIDNYLDLGKRIQIFQDGAELIDTVFTKNNFDSYLGTDFLEKAILKGYWLDDFNDENSSLIFFGTITKPETDWTFAFYHIFSLEKEQFMVQIYEDEKI